MAALGVDQHGVDAHRVELPFPPDVRAVAALAAPDAIGALARLQHQALAAERARLLATAASASQVRATTAGLTRSGRRRPCAFAASNA